ncbi:Golgi-associated PDZ and coiled-coil motif-containing protein [Halotydeus destructor]|nr:Golgi-associated PDZ and coiled-coil motif-containing protein [Halotydeus destructor]
MATETDHSSPVTTEQPVESNVSKVGFKWLDILEKEFDTAYADLDVLIGQLDDEPEIILESRTRMTALSSAFVQLVHKSSVIFESNTRYQKELSEVRTELVKTKAAKLDIEDQLHERDKQLDSIAMTINSRKLGSFMPVNSSPKRKSAKTRNNLLIEEVNQLRLDNASLRNYILNLQSELYGAKLASKYLDKELAGRIQQIQLLGKSDLAGANHERLWAQLEAEINLHRHKTVVKACRGRHVSSSSLAMPDGHEQSALRKSQGVGAVRNVEFTVNQDEGLGISITGGKEHGIPVLISEIHPESAAHRSGQLYVGDAILSVNSIDLREARHQVAAQVLSSEKGKLTLEVLFINPDEVNDENNSSSILDKDKSEPSNGFSYADEQFMTDFAQKVPMSVEQGDVDEFYLASHTPDVDSSDNDDHFSSVTDAMSSPSRGVYPGVARLCPLPVKEHRVETCSKKETMID